MANRIAVTLAAAVVVATGLVGCGSSSGASRQSAAPVRSSAPPAGFTVYHAYGFSFAAPKGLKSVAGDLQDLPAGASATTLTPQGQSPGVANTMIFAMYNPNLQYTVDQVASNLQKADATNPAETGVQTSISSTHVGGARTARIVSESYTAENPHTLYRRTWLMVSPRPGTLIDLVVVVEPKRGGTLDPSTVIDSFRLGS